MGPDSLKHRLLNLNAAAVLLVTTFMLYCLNSTTADPDLWGYLAFGRLFWGQGPFPYEDVFAYVPTLKPWVYHEWLTGVLFYPLYRTLGGPGLQVLRYALGLATVGVVYLTARRRGAEFLPTVLLILFALPALRLGYSPVRAQVFTYLGFAIFLYLLEDARLSERWGKLWLLAPIEMVWCNLHGGFLAGLGLIFLYAVGAALSRRPFRAYLVWFLVAGLATVINPYGLKYWSYLIQAVTMPRPEITEWFSVVAGYQRGIVESREFFHFLGLIAVALFMALWGRWREITPILVLLFTIYLAVEHNRHRIFFAITFGTYLPVLLTAYFQELRGRPGFMARVQRLGWRIPVLALILFTGFWAYRFASINPLKLEVPREPDLTGIPGPYYPVGAIDYLEQHRLGKKLLVHFDWGEYCLWRLYPQCLVAIDGRYETVYPVAVHKEYFDFLAGRKSWRNFLADYPPDLILIGNGSRIYGLVSGDPEWRQVYADPGCALFRRVQAPAGPAQARSQPGGRSEIWPPAPRGSTAAARRG
jgi:hypothetical protein